MVGPDHGTDTPPATPESPAVDTQGAMAEMVSTTGIASLPPQLQSYIEAYVRQFGPDAAQAKMAEVADVIARVERGEVVDSMAISDPQLRQVAEQYAQHQQDKAAFQQNAMGVLMGGAAALGGGTPASEDTAASASLGGRILSGLSGTASAIGHVARESIAGMTDRLFNRPSPAITDYRDFGPGTSGLAAMQEEARTQYVVAAMGKKRGMEGPGIG
jgi:hypothetical protein